ncbi:MAG: ABC transporter ATP-binding protein [Methanobacteriota archaeon]
MITVKNVTKRYRKNAKSSSWKTRVKQMFSDKKRESMTALNNVDFQANGGEIIGILGPNGAGKTTLLKIIAGLLVPEVGQGEVNGFDIVKDREKVRTSVNFLMSGGWVIFDYKFSVRDNLRFWGVYQGLSLKDVDQRVAEVLKVVELEEKKDEFPENISAGMRQRMNLARCLLVDRPVYLLDEPTANLDPYSAEFIRKFVKEKLRTDNKTIVLATHNLWEAELLCDRIVILNKGEVLLADKTEEIKRKIGKEVAIIEIESEDAELLKTFRGLDFVDSATLEGNRLRIFGDVKRNLPRIIDICRERTTVTSVNVQELSLNDIFIQLVSRGET